jgi:hypothetical protein
MSAIEQGGAALACGYILPAGFQHWQQGEFTHSNSERGTANRIGHAANPAGDAHANRRLCDRKEREGLGDSLARRLHSDLRPQESGEVAVRTAVLAAQEHAVAVTLLFAEAAPQDDSSEMTRLSFPQSMIA